MEKIVNKFNTIEFSGGTSQSADQRFTFEDAQVIWSALRDYEGSKTIRGKSLDFADALITRKSEYVAQAKGAKFGGLFSFDKAIAQLSGAKPMSA